MSLLVVKHLADLKCFVEGVYGDVVFCVGNIEGKFQNLAKFHNVHVATCFRNSSPGLSVPKVQMTEVCVKRVNENCAQPNVNTAEDLRRLIERERLGPTVSLNTKFDFVILCRDGPIGDQWELEVSILLATDCNCMKAKLPPPFAY